MSKEVLKYICASARKDSYRWALYFFKIDKRAKQPFKANKVRFKNNTYLLQYAQNLLSATETFQIDQISEVQDYDRWRYYYPKYDTTQLWAKVPSQELGDTMVKAFKNRTKD